MTLSQAEHAQYRAWMEQAAEAAQSYNGSEVSEQLLFQPLLAMDAFIRSKNNGLPSTDLELAFAKQVWPENPMVLEGFNGLLEAASQAYVRKLRQANDYEHVLSILQAGGTVVKRHDATFVQTDAGELHAATTAAPKPVEFQTQPRLAKLIQHLKDEGIYTDDIIAHVCQPDPGMVRKLPYVLLHIPRLNKEIAVCDQVGEITFVANKNLGTDVWEHLSKDQLKARQEITAIPFHHEEQWWQDIRGVLMAERVQPEMKLDVEKIAASKPPLDVGLIKQCILAHRQETGKWPTQQSGLVAYGPYQGAIQWHSINSLLIKGHRGLPAGTSLAALNDEVSEERGLDYINRLRQEKLEIEQIKDSILAHRQATGTWPTLSSGPVQHGAYKDKAVWSGIDLALARGFRGLPGELSIAQLNEEVSREHGLDYVHPFKQEHLQIDKIKLSILVHRQATGSWPTTEQVKVQYGPYAGEITWTALHAALVTGGRGLPGGSSLAALNEEVSKERALDYVNFRKQESYEIDQIKACILAHRQATNTWPTRKNGMVQYGPYANKATWSAWEAALMRGNRGLPGNSSLTMLNEEVSREHELDYTNLQKQAPLEIEQIKACIFAHRQATGSWPRLKSGLVQHGPYAGAETWSGLNALLHVGGRTLPGGTSLTALNEEVSKQHNLDYVNHLKQEKLEIESIKACILAYRRETGAWPVVESKAVLYGPYANKIMWNALDGALRTGGRGLTGGSSLAALSTEVSNEHGLDYVNIFKQEPLDPEQIKLCIYEHRQRTGHWPTQKTGNVHYGPYAEKETWGAIHVALDRGRRGLTTGLTLSQLNKEVSDKYGLDYVKGKHTARALAEPSNRQETQK